MELVFHFAAVVLMHLLLGDSVLTYKISSVYPLSRAECIRDTGSSVTCSHEEFYDAFCTCRPCSATRLRCKQANTTDELCRRLAELYYCLETTTGASTSTSTTQSTKSSSWTVSLQFSTTAVYNAAIRHGTALSNVASNATIVESDQPPANRIIIGIVCSLILIACAFIILVVLVRRNKLPRRMCKWPVFNACRSASQKEINQVTIESVPLNNMPSVATNQRPAFTTQLSDSSRNGVTKTSDSWHEPQDNGELIAPPGIPGGSEPMSADQLARQQRRQRDLENAERRNAGNKSNNNSV